MRTISLLLLVAVTALAESRRYHRGRHRRELLVRTKRRWVLSTIHLEEEDKGPFPRVISTMFNNMTGKNHRFTISGMGVDEEPKGTISIHPSTGDVSVHKPIDREEYEKPFHIKFEIFDKDTNVPLDKELSFDVEVQDINDNKPLFNSPRMTADVKESVLEGVLQVWVTVKDRDLANTSNSRTTVTVISQNPKEPKIGVTNITHEIFQLNMTGGCFDFDKIKKYEVVLHAQDHGKVPLSSTAVITLNIVDANSHPPIFKEREYRGVVNESEIKYDILRVAVEDKDTPYTPGWRAKYTITNGNKDNNYKIETDRNTNEGILSVIKGKDYERTTNTTLQIEVENEEQLWVCKSKSKGKPPPHDTINITIEVIDVNDPPEFKNSPARVYLEEEEQPGKVLFVPSVEDVDNDKESIRYVLLQDPAGWVSIDEKTGNIKSIKKMDRESPYINGTDPYTVLIGAIDTGKPPATGTGTVLIHLRDINDNKPQLANKGVVMCGNKDNKVKVPVKDDDLPPYSGPFSFSLAGDDKNQERWKLEPAFGEEGGLVSRKTLAYGNYSVPLKILDQQNIEGHDTLEVMVCDCGKKNVCRGKEAATSSLGAASIGLLFLGLLLFLLLLLLFMCQCGKKDFKHIPIVQDEGNQTLIKYNQEGGGSECKAEPTMFLTPTHSVAVTDGLKQGTMQMSQTASVTAQDMDNMYSSSGFTMMNSNMTSQGTQHQRETVRSQRGQSMYSTWASRNNTYQGGSLRYNNSLRSNQHIADHIDRRLYMIQGNHAAQPGYLPHEYAYEGQGSKCQSLDRLSLDNLGDDLNFLNDLGPKFKTLGGICHQRIQGENIKL